MAGLMKDATFRASQEAGVDGPRVKRINDLVRELRDERPGVSVPQIPPHYDARSARILLLFSDPGPMASGKSGSGFLSNQNDDPSAKRLLEIATTVGLTDKDALPWNAYPWYFEDQSTTLKARHIQDGLVALMRLLDLHPSIRAIVAHGNNAHWSVKKFESTHAGALAARGISVWKVRHTGNLAWTMPPSEKTHAMARMLDSYRQAMHHVGLESTAATGDELEALSTGNPLLEATRQQILQATEPQTRVDAAVAQHVAGLSEHQVRTLLEALILADLVI